MKAAVFPEHGGPEVLEVRERVQGADHFDTLLARSNLAHYLSGRGDLEEAVALYREVLEGRTRALGETHPSTVASCFKKRN